MMSSSITQRVKSFHNADWLPLAAHTLHSHVTKIALSPSGKTSRRNEINAETATKSKSYVFDLKYVQSADNLYYTTNVPGNGHCGIYAILRGGDVLAEQSDWSFCDRLGDYKFTWNDALKVHRELHDFIMSIEADFHSKKTCPMYNWKGKCDSVSMYYGTKRKHSHLKDFLLKLWDPHYFRELVGKHVEDLSRWLNTTNHIPLFALWLKCTIFVYSKLMTPRKPGHYSDQTFIAFYRHDDNVQVGIFWEKLVAPFADSLLVFYQNKHYQQCRLHPDVELSQFKLVDYNSDDDKLIHGGNVDLCDSSTGSATPTQSKSTDNSDSDNPSVNDTPTQTVERTDNSDSDDQSVQSPYKNLKSPRRIVYDSDSSLQGQPEKKQKTKQIVIHRCPIGSPEQRKLANESDRTVSEFWVRDYKRNGEVYTEWRNDRLSSVDISCDLVRRLIYLVPTPHCTVTPFKCAWIPPSKVYDAMDIVNSLLKQGLPFFKHHLLLRSSYNWVKPVYEMDSLKEAMKLIREGNMTMDELFDDGTCGHLKGPDGLCIAKHKATRAKTDMIAYKVGACAHKKDRLSVCQTACYIGFMYSDITHMWNDDGSISKGTVKLWFQCDGNCVHSKTRDLNRLVGEDRQAVLKRHFLDEAEELSDRKAEKVFNRENGGTNPNGEGKIQTYSQVYKIKQEAKQAYKETKLGLVSKNDFVNFYKAISDVRIQDIEWRGGDINYLMSDNSVDTRFAGILRYFRINYDCYYNKKTTPLEALFFDYYALLAFHYCAKDGRVVLNIDGTGSQVGWGVVLGPNVCVQRWEMTMRALFLAANEEAKDVVKKNVKPYSLWQYHATKTDTEGLTEALKSFFGGQTDLGLPFHKPLGFLTDCAPQIIAAIMRALAFDDSDEIITKVMYCNVMTVLIAHCETRQWEKELTKKVLDFALTILPTLCKWCRAHVIRAIDRWISRTQSPAIVANRKSFHIMAITLARHMTSSLSFIHSIINFGFVMYISQCTFLRVKKTDAITYRPNVSTEKMNEITSLVKAFFHRQYSALSRKLSQCYKDLTDITCVDRKNYMTESLIQSVIDAAVSEKLQFSVSYCVDNDGDTGKLLSNILFGCYGKLKDEEDDERWEVISSVPEARFLYNQVSSTEFSEINGSSSETVLVLNPLFDPSLSGYMMAQWGRNFALFHTGVNDMCLRGRDAVL